MKPEELNTLQLAAKAADFIFVEPDDRNPVEGLMMINWTVWNPLKDSRDALDLAMKLVYEGKMRIQMATDYLDIFEYWDGVWVPHSYTIKGEPNEGFRLAVTTVAAEIGKRLCK